MKYIKYLVTLFLLVAIFICTGEIFQLHISQLYTKESYIEVKLEENESNKEFFKFLQKKSVKDGVGVYYQNSDTYFDGSTNLDIYFSDNNVKNFYIKTRKVNDGNYNSIFMGKSEIKYGELGSCPETKKKIKFNIIGDEKAKEEFIVSLDDSYFVEDYGLNNNEYKFYSEEAFLLQLALWVLAAAIVILMSFYECAVIKKETAIRSSMGEKSMSIYLKRAFSDTLAFVLMFLLCIIVLKNVTNVFFSFTATLLLFGILVLCNALSLLPLAFVDIKKAFSDVKSESLLTFSHAVKIFTCLITVTALSATIVIFSQFSYITSQEDFYEKYKDYSFAAINYSDIHSEDEDLKSSEELYYLLQRQCFKNQGVLVQSAVYESYGEDGLVFNKTAKEYLEKEIPELNGKLNEETVYMIYPEDKGMEQAEQVFDVMTGGYLFAHDCEVKFVSYKRNVKILAVDDVYKGYCEYTKNPFIAFSNIDESKYDLTKEKGKKNYAFADPYVHRTMYRINDEQFRDFLVKNGVDPDEDYCSLTNVYSRYTAVKEQTEKLSKLVVFLLAVISLIELLQIYTVVKLEYTVHAKTLAIKKVLGYGIFSRMKGIYIGTFVTFFISAAAVTVVNAFLHLMSTAILLAVMSAFLVIEIAIIALFTVKFEKSQITKILKGGIL